MSELAKPDPLAEALEDVINEQADEAALAREADPDAWLPEWYAEKEARLVGAEAAAQARYDAELSLLQQGLDGVKSEVRRQRSGLEWKWAEPLRKELNARLQGGKSRSINTTYGKVGFRTSGGGEKLVVDDEDAAIEDALLREPSAVKMSLLTSMVHKDLAGTHFLKPDATERLYVGKTVLGKKELEGGETPLLEGGEDNASEDNDPA